MRRSRNLVRRIGSSVIAASLLIAGYAVPALQVPTALAAAPNALTFNGTSQYVQVADSSSLFLPNDFTLEAWVNPAAVSGFHDIVGKGGYEIALQSSGSGFVAQMQIEVNQLWY